jgi:hypothetical protein
MAIGVVAQCDTAQEHEAPQQLAIALTVIFAVYGLLSIWLSGVAVWRSSHHAHAAPSGKAGGNLQVVHQVRHVAPSGA